MANTTQYQINLTHRRRGHTFMVPAVNLRKPINTRKAGVKRG